MFAFFKSNKKNFHNYTGIRRIQSELKNLRKSMNDPQRPLFGVANSLSQDEKGRDNNYIIQLNLSNFNSGCAASDNLNEDLKLLAKRGGKDHIKLEILIPKNYPNDPPFVRVVYPRCKWYTGHVTAGGSICLELLTHSGSDRGWNKNCDLECVLVSILAAFFDNTVALITTRNGPGGVSGSLRVDLDNEWHRVDPSTHYSLSEAKTAFTRTKESNGW